MKKLPKLGCTHFFAILTQVRPALCGVDTGVQLQLCRLPFSTHYCNTINITSGPTPQVASSAAHKYVCSSKLRDVVWVRVFAVDYSNSLILTRYTSTLRSQHRSSIEEMQLYKLPFSTHYCNKINNTSGPTPQVASSAAHMYVCSSKLCDVVWVRVFAIDYSNSLPDHAMFGGLEDGSWVMWKMHQFTLAKHTLATRSLTNSTHAPCLWLEALYTLLRTRRRHPSMAPRLGRVSLPWEWQATFLPVDSSDKRLIQLHDRLPRGSQAAWRRSRIRNVVHDQRGAVEHKHTYIHVLTLWTRDQWQPFRRFWGSWVTTVLSSSTLGTRQV